MVITKPATSSHNASVKRVPQIHPHVKRILSFELNVMTCIALEMRMGYEFIVVDSDHKSE